MLVRAWSALHSGAVVTAMVLAAVAIHIDERLLVLYFTSGLLGVAEGVSSALTSSFLSTLFVNDPTSTFSVYRTVEPILTASFLLFVYFTDSIAIMMICGSFGILSFVSINLLLYYQRWLGMRDVKVVMNPLRAHPSASFGDVSASGAAMPPDSQEDLL